MAIFKLAESEPDWHHYVRASQLLATDTVDYTYFAGQRAFSVGYAILCDERYFDYWEYYSSMAPSHPLGKHRVRSIVGGLDSVKFSSLLNQISLRSSKKYSTPFNDFLCLAKLIRLLRRVR
jgi:hypothetical protein